MSFRVSAFADEIAKDLNDQLAALREQNVEAIELRGVWGKNALQLTTREIRDIRSAADAEGIGFSSIGSPLGKFPLDGDFNAQLEGVRRALEYAAILDAPYVRVFSYYIPKGDEPATHRSQVLDWLGRLVKEAENTDVVLAHENESGIYGNTGDRCLDLLTSLDSPAFAGVFDFANFVHEGENTLECWSKLRDRIVYFHIKDMNSASRKVVPAGDGDGNVAAILRDAKDRGFDGYLSLEPHLSGEYGETGVERFRAAVAGIRRVLSTLDV
jgi:sugar phosphate isomerase/epimerase